MTRRLPLATLLGIAWTMHLASLGCLGSNRPLETLKGTESAELVKRAKGTVIVDRAVGGIVGVELPSLAQVVVRRPDTGGGPALALGGPDGKGRVAFIEDLGDRHALKRVNLDGSQETAVSTRDGSGLWGMVAGKHISLSRANGLLAFVSGIHLVDDSMWRVGRLEVFDLASGAAIPIESTLLSDNTLSWFPDGVRLAINDLMSRKEAEKILAESAGTKIPYEGPFYKKATRVPAVFVLDTRTGARQLVYPGQSPVVSPDGGSVLMWAPNGLVLFDLQTRQTRTVKLPGITDGPYAFVGEAVVLYMGLPTEGTPTGYSSHNSPLVGKKPMRTLKIADLSTGEFQTVMPSVDPRAEVSFGP